MHSSHKHLFESLERRQLLANNVSVIVGADLVARLNGDSKNNEVVITQSPGQGYLVTGLHGTTINGSPAIIIRTTPALKFNISLGNGNDKVTFNGAFGTQDLSINMGNGKDVVSLLGVTVFGNTSIDTANGDDQIILSGIHGTGNLLINTGNGKDSVNVPAANQIGGSVSIDGGNGKNALTGGGSISAGTSAAVQSFNSGKGSAKSKKKHDPANQDD